MVQNKEDSNTQKGFWGNADVKIEEHITVINPQKIKQPGIKSEALHEKIKKLSKEHWNQAASHYNLTLEEVVNEIINLKNSIEGIEFAKASLLERFLFLKNYVLNTEQFLNEAGLDKFINELKESLFKVTAENYNETEILNITMDFSLPHYPKNINMKMKYYEVLSYVYKYQLRDHLQAAYEKSNMPNFKEDKIFILITHYFKNNKVADLDNRFHSFIFNALRAAHIIRGDSWTDVAYMENGLPSNRGINYTTVTISRYEEMINCIKFIQQQQN